MTWEQQCRDLAAQQYGLVARHHLRAIGCDADHWWRARRNGRWEAVSPRVLRLRGVPEDDSQRVLAAVLDASPGAVLHGPTALAWVGLRGFDLRALHVARCRGISGAECTLANVHRLRALHAHHVDVVRGVPTESTLRAIWCEAGRFSHPARFELGLQRIGRQLDEAHVADLVSWTALHAMVEDIRQRGRRGTSIMRTLAADRPIGSSPTESRNEQRFEQILDTRRRAPMLRQHVVGGHEVVGRCDFRDADLPLIAEVNSIRFHTAPTDRQRDEVRYRRLVDAGFTVAVIWEGDLWTAPSQVVQLVDEARRLAAHGTHRVVHSPGSPWAPSPRGARGC